jgi:hypothetical protein
MFDHVHPDTNNPRSTSSAVVPTTPPPPPAPSLPVSPIPASASAPDDQSRARYFLPRRLVVF